MSAKRSRLKADLRAGNAGMWLRGLPLPPSLHVRMRREAPSPSCIHVCSQALSLSSARVSSVHPSITARLLPWGPTGAPPPTS